MRLNNNTDSSKNVNPESTTTMTTTITTNKPTNTYDVGFFSKAVNAKTT